MENVHPLKSNAYPTIEAQQSTCKCCSFTSEFRFGFLKESVWQTFLVFGREHYYNGLIMVRFIHVFLLASLQIWQQFPCSFEFTEDFLIVLFEHAYSSQFGKSIATS